MSFYNKYPYSDFHELNLDWLIKEFDALTNEFTDVNNEVLDMETAIEDFRAWFDNLDVSAEVNLAIDRMIADGSFQEIIETRLDTVLLHQVQTIAPPIINEWLNDNITEDPTTVIDASLSLQNAAAEAFNTGVYVKTLSDLNNQDMLNQFNHRTLTSHGVTFTWNSDGTVTVSGTADSNDNAMFNIYYDETTLPAGFEPGKTLRGFCTRQDDIIFEIYTYRNGAFQQEWRFNSVVRPASFTIPSNATGMLIRLRVLSGTTVNRTIKIHVMTGLTPDELLSLTGDNLQYKGVLDNDQDIAELTDTGIYLLTGNATAPGSGYGMLYHITASAVVRTQTVYRFATLAIYYRRYIQGSGWSDWTAIDSLSELINPLPCKYVAFGDSLVQGAIWNTSGSGHVTTYARDVYKIPYRISNAIHATEFINRAVGGMGYCMRAGDNQMTFFEYISSAAMLNDVSTADIITLQGGINDGDYELNLIQPEVVKIINYIRSVNPRCQIVFVQASPYTPDNQPFTTTYPGGWNLNQFDTMMATVCNNYNVGYVNWYGCSLITKWSDLSGGGGNYAHPTDEYTYKLMGNFIAGKVAAIFQN